MINPEVVQKVRDEIGARVAETKKQRLEDTEKFLKGDLLDIESVRAQIAPRLARQGYFEAAQMVQKSFELEKAREDEEKIQETRRRVHEAMVGTSEIMPIRFVHQGSRVASCVGRIVFERGRGANGTGFMVSPRVMVTNNHVLPDENAARENLVQFGYATSDEGGIVAPIEFRFAPNELFLTSDREELDVTVVAVEPLNQRQEKVQAFGWTTLLDDDGTYRDFERVNIIHHPEGQPKRVSLRQNFLVHSENRYVHYLTDTEHGSSGSPVFNDEWEVIAVHHGYTEVTDQEEIQIYRRILGAGAPGAGSKTLNINEGIRVDRILEWLRNKRSGIPQKGRSLLVDVLDRRPPEVARAEAPSETFAPAGASSPVSIIINVGGAGGRPIVTASGGDGGGGGGGGPGTLYDSPRDNRYEIYSDEMDSDRSAARALAHLQARREDSYFPSDNEVKIRKERYYQNLDGEMENLGPDGAFERLSALLGDTFDVVSEYPTELEGLERTMNLESNAYDRARAHLYTYVDLQPNRMLKCIYTGALISPEQLMLNDLLRSMGFRELLPRRYRNSDFLECEHVVCQSWFDKRTAGVADLHHIFASDGQANLYRSNRPYRDLTGQGVEGPPDLPPYIAPAGRRHGDAFMPANNRPIVARATLYFLIAHPGWVKKAIYGPQEIEMLKRWAKQAKPDTYERHRNEAIFEVQGNRNPLIDYPKWVDKIDFSKGIDNS